jgi:hypothetical protein
MSATRLSDGIADFRNSRRFFVNSTVKLLRPVRLPEGLAKLSTSLLPMGSGTTMNTMGIVLSCLDGASRRWIYNPWTHLVTIKAGT